MIIFLPCFVISRLLVTSCGSLSLSQQMFVFFSCSSTIWATTSRRRGRTRTAVGSVTTTFCPSTTHPYVLSPVWSCSLTCVRMFRPCVWGCVPAQDEEMPLVYVAVFIEHASAFMEEFLGRLTTLNYPSERIRLFIHNNVRHKTQTCTHTPLLCPCHL